MVRGLKLGTIVLVAIIFLTGCSSEKTLTCTNSEDQSGIKMEQEIIMTFKDDKISNVKMNINSKATSSTIEDNWDMFASMMDEQFETRKESGLSLTTSNDKDTHTYKVSLEVDLDKAKDDSLEEYGLDGIADKEATYKDTKKEAEKDGFTCK